MIKVKNRAPAQVQVTAEQLVRSAREHQVDDEKKIEQLKISTKINDEEELKMHQAEKRKEYEGKLRHTLVDLGSWLRYARWEESQMEFRRARAIFERAIEVENRQPALWIKYAEFEMRNKFVNHARNVLDRAVQHLPRQAALWYKYAHFEETLNAIDKARLVFERWMQWHPEEQAWVSYINFEVRHGDLVNARNIYERFCGCYPKAKSYIKYAKWEESNGQLALSRNIFERALEELDRSESLNQTLYIAFARFEERCKEFDRARAIYKQSLDLLPKESSRELYDAFVIFERQHGDRGSIENVLVAKRRAQYEDQLKLEPRNYDVWFDYTRLEEAQAQAEAMAAQQYLEAVESESLDKSRTGLFKDKVYASKVVSEARDRVRQVYDRAVAQVPPTKDDKSFWRRYIYLWINYALFEELDVEDVSACRNVYKRCLNVVPHKKFTFSKLWIMAAQFEVRQKNLEEARKIFGQAIGRCPREKVFKAYIQLELQLGNVDRCRTLYGKYLEFAPHNCFIWQKFAELEHSVGETARCRAIYELAVNQPILDMPETLWKRYIDFEISLKSKNGRGNAEKLYERLLEKTQHVKVWISFAKFQMLINRSPEKGREVFEKAYQNIKAKQDGDEDIISKEDRALLLNSWLDTERKIPDNAVNIEKMQDRQPRKVKKRREVESGSWEEYTDYLFPDDPKKGLKLLEMARKWKKNKASDAEPEERDAKKQRVDAKPAAKDENEIDLDDI